jgi:hypothetical protein
MARRPARRRDKNGIGGIVWVGTLVALVAAIIFAWLFLQRSHRDGETDKQTGCLTTRDTPQAAMFLIDSTDRLTPENAKHVIDTIVEDESQLPEYSRLVIVPFGDDTAAPLAPVFSKCMPSRKARLDQNQHSVDATNQDFQASLDKLKDALATLPPSKSSPIAAQIIRAAGDPVLQWKGARRTMVVITDGLESSIYWSRDLKLIDPPANLLNGVDVEYVELGNAKANKLQSDQMRQQWRAWFEKAGASVRMTAPGYATGGPNVKS